jgi:hypothetical protein
MPIATQMPLEMGDLQRSKLKRLHTKAFAVSYESMMRAPSDV